MFARIGRVDNINVKLHVFANLTVGKQLKMFCRNFRQTSYIFISFNENIWFISRQSSNERSKSGKCLFFPRSHFFFMLFF